MTITFPLARFCLSLLCSSKITWTVVTVSTCTTIAITITITISINVLILVTLPASPYSWDHRCLPKAMESEASSQNSFPEMQKAASAFTQFPPSREIVDIDMVVSWWYPLHGIFLKILPIWSRTPGWLPFQVFFLTVPVCHSTGWSPAFEWETDIGLTLGLADPGLRF